MDFLHIPQKVYFKYMYLGYARVSTEDQKLDLQKDALKKIGCKEIFTDVISGAKTKREGLDKLLNYARPGDTIVVWKLDRLGRSLQHLIETIKILEVRGIGFRSLQENIDTNTSGGKLIFHVFGALAEFERDLIRERTQAGLKAARARGRVGGRPKAMDEKKIRQAKALMADTENSIADICKTLKIGKTTLYKYVKPTNANGADSFNDKTATLLETILPKAIPINVKPSKLAKATKQALPEPAIKTTTVKMYLRIENNSKFVRGKKKSKEDIEIFVFPHYKIKDLGNDFEYEVTFSYQDDADLENQIYELADEMNHQADSRNCFVEVDFQEIGTDRHW